MGATLNANKAQVLAEVRNTNTEKDEAMAALRTELNKMKKSALRMRAVGLHIQEDALDEALDADDTKAAFIELIMRRQAEFPDEDMKTAFLEVEENEFRSGTGVCDEERRTDRKGAAFALCCDKAYQTLSDDFVKSSLENDDFVHKL